MTDDYRIEKTRRRVEVTLANAKRLEGDVFVQPFARFRSGPEEPLDLLNDDSDPFLPLGLTNGDVLLVQKSQIAVVGTELPAVDDSVERGVVGMPVELGLIGGSRLRGSLVREAGLGRPRLVDLHNDS